MIKDSNVNLLGLVETKSASINEIMVRNMWRSNDFSWDVIQVVNARGGLLCVWGTSFFKHEVVLKGDRRLCVNGKIQETNFKCAFGLVYGPHERIDKNRLWIELLEVKDQIDTPLLMIGDLNEVLKFGDRKGD